MTTSGATDSGLIFATERFVNKNGGAGVVITDVHNNATTKLSFPAGRFTSSYQAEMTAIAMALKHLDEDTDSLSSLTRCKDLTEILLRLKP